MPPGKPLRLWKQYRNTIIENCTEHNYATDNGIQYWRDVLFANTMVYIFPFCILAMTPDVIMNFYRDMTDILILDTVVVLIFSVIAFTRIINMRLKKIVLISSAYIASLVLLIVFETPAPGMLFLYACCILSLLLFHEKYAFLWSHINLVICVIVSTLILLDIKVIQENDTLSIGMWFTISSNLVLLSYLASALIPILFRGIQSYIDKQLELQEELLEQKESLKKTLITLEEKNNDLEKFAYVASHDLQEPLRMVSSFLNQLKKKYNNILDEKASQYIFYAVDGARRMRQIILDLLEYSRAGKNEENNLEKENINKVLDDTMMNISQDIKKKNARIIRKNIPDITVYRTLFTQIFQNLISNALKYSKKDVKPKIIISCEDSDSHWTFSVKDNGIGIEEEYFDKIFIIFQRLHNRNEYDGTGTGLAIVKKVIEQLDGNVWVNSKLNKGSTFYFTVKK
jgi:signal transduction histidine kinase